MRRCTGACCEKFHLTVPGGLAREAERVLEKKPDELTAADIDTLKVVEMVIPYPLRYPDKDGVPNSGDLYRCRHFDEETRNCTNYADRPVTCRRFPYGRPCSFGDACTWTAARESGIAPPLEWIQERLWAIKRPGGRFPFANFMTPEYRTGHPEGQELNDDEYR